MGEAIFHGLKSSGKTAFDLSVGVRSEEKAQELKKHLGVPVSVDLTAQIKKAEIVIVCVKPQQAESVLRQVAKSVGAKHTVISICAGITTERLRRFLGSRCAIVRAMPNTPCLIRKGVTLLCAEKTANPESLLKAQSIFECLGEAIGLDEQLFDGATGISGCGPAYVFLILEALSDAGVKVGLPRDLSTRLAALTFVGSSQMLLDRKEHPAKLKDEVTTPGGITIDALSALEEGKIRIALLKAVVAATDKSRLMGQKF